MSSIKRFLILAAASTLLLQCSPKHLAATNPIAPPPRPKPGLHSEPLSPFTYLRKLSLHIRGQLPSRREYGDLTRALEKAQGSEFLRQRLDAYLASDQHIDKMTFRLEELFALQASPVPFYSPLAELGDHGASARPALFVDYPLRNSMNELFRQIASRNLSWDALLTGKHYSAFPLVSESFLSDLVFYSVAGGTPPKSDKVLPVDFAEDDPRAAGVITTGRFFNRYVNTALNKNRRRAAALFRVFLCDDMKAVVVDEKDKQGEILDRVFPSQSGNNGGGPEGLDGRHGADPACMKCHYKLDPMGLTLQSSGLILAPLASKGALAFTDQAGQKINVDVAGVGELGQAITQQPDYVRCQVKHFWRWFVGEDAQLSEGLTQELAAKFNEVRRRPNDFIAYLVNRPGFGSTDVQGMHSALIADVKNTLQNCNGCHAAEGITSFTQWPIEGDAVKHERWLTRIRRSLSLDGATRPRAMPPAKSAWQPEPKQLATLQQWLDLGAPYE